ncbi:EAL domain-containing protein [Schinkia azotoformans]|uniref:PAS/PAC sensor-containing diguanylate cyclase/phosphodiesterase n=1 Tax=Schinkia azotoformans LMG 9581 TaxID=1131731 RepID=K6DUW9_SCHAZ|nr:EAL domain-containing protein [Schinkia azotoformans]EKN64606.1 PAS/PAC sensor-containing diguanylate cyclase/phosphodiesterase [Schinkia azotoformans LMG 9581]MEC1637913.1 EAL domain-containing protein [Schinkia azotoformans]MEC1721696.1 EAL domain-containing protein [Schinkia azotoformans]MEC1944809.1 EAL domain-containing protein [Schinkia azotoformans]MED4352071.1 EAL domain-containing protein [Schinkia azotoformans]
MPIRIKLIIMSLLFLAVPSLLIGIIGYQSSRNSLKTLGAESLQTDVRMTIEMIEALDKQVKTGKVLLEDAQEQVKEAILGKKDANGNRPINPRLNLGKHGFIFIINSAGVELAHPNFEGMDVWEIKTTDGVYSTKEVVRAANNGGGFVTYEWPLPDNPNVHIPKITYAEKDPNWDWIVCAGAYLPDFNAGANRVLYILLFTLGISLLAGVIVILWFSKKMTKPIIQVAEQVKLIARGDYTQEPIEITSKDEIGELVLNFNIMKENQKKAILKQKEYQERIEYMAFHDDLTKLPNLRYIKEKLTQEMQSHKPFTLLILDVDRFKQSNEALGHSIADLILKSVADRLKEQFPSHVFVGRLTGDEFAIIYPGLNQEDEWISVCKQIQSRINEPLQVKNLLLNVSVTIGSVVYNNNKIEVDEFLKHANMALMEAQQQQVPFQMYQPSMDGKAFDRLVLENHLHHALQRNELRLVYQPQVDIGTGQIQGVEALLRWHHPSYGFISPAEFIPIAENTGLIIPIGEWVLRTACRQIKEWHDQGLSFLQIAVNLSSRQFYSQDLIETVKGILLETGLPPGDLELEITESMMMNMEHASKTLQDLKHLGCKIAIDDFGTGYSSLNYLKHLPIHRLKIDQSFIRDLAENEQDDTIVSTIISMAQHLQLDVIAEGVETPEQMDILRKKQCTHVQGYLYSPPLAPENFLQQWDQLLQKANTLASELNE